MINFRKRLINLFSYRSTIWGMSIRQFKGKYSGSTLGIWWAVATPLILALSINFIFTKVFKVQMENFTLFLLSGILPWLFFSNTLGEISNCFSGSASLLRQCLFPREIIPITYIIANFL